VKDIHSIAVNPATTPFDTSIPPEGTVIASNPDCDKELTRGEAGTLPGSALTPFLRTASQARGLLKFAGQPRCQLSNSIRCVCRLVDLPLPKTAVDNRSKMRSRKRRI
jgi:hypothetical protein